MSDYRRVRVLGGCFFFTVVTRNREPWLTEPAALVRLREALRKVIRTRPFRMDAVVVLPDHLHAIWRLPPDDDDFSTRWRLIKHYLSTTRGRNWHWQPRFWEHMIRDDDDWRRHVGYIHYNPVKHGHATSPQAWPYSSFRHAVKRGWHDASWGAMPPTDLPARTGE